MLFRDLSVFLQAIESVSSRLAITEKLAKLFRSLTPDEMAIVPYLLQGRISPAYRGVEFGMAEKSVVKAAALALGRDPKDLQMVVRTVGDLGLAVEAERAAYQSLDQRDLTVSEVFADLVRVTEQSGAGSQEAKSQILSHLFSQLDPLSCRYISRIPLGTLRLGASEITILDALSWMAAGDKSQRPMIERAYQVRPDLGYISSTMKAEGRDGLAQVTPVIGTPILMMRAERLSSGIEIVEKLGTCVIEPKYDGLRLQIHMRKIRNTKSEILNNTKSLKTKNEKTESEPLSTINCQLSTGVKIFTRGLEDATAMYPDIVAAVLTELDCESAIIEGEALGYDAEHDTFLPFQETMQRKRTHDVAETATRIPLRLMAFDLLVVDGESYIQRPFHERRAKLRSLVQKDQGVLHMAPETQVTHPEEIERLFDRYVTAGLEGIMAKKIDAPYRPGAREYSWVKLKRSYSEKVQDTIDCVVMGYDLGKGKRAGFGIGAVLVGVYDPAREVYLTVAKIGTGMTDEEWRQLKAISCKLQAASKPAEYEVMKIMEPDVWVTPQTVLEIRCDELTHSKIHTSGWGLRFPRLERSRPDKGPTDATTVEELVQITQRAFPDDR